MLQSISKWFADYLTRNKTKDKPKEKSEEKVNNIKKMYQNMSMLVLVVTMIILICSFFYFGKNPLFELLTILTVLGAFYLGGSAIGFIFAIPKSVQAPKTQSKDSDKDGPYNDNTNLEEISDWLTKIIVGISLTQFNKLQDELHSAATNIAAAIKSGHQGAGNQDYYVFSYAIIVFYVIAGMIIGYMWARIDFPKILTQNKKDINKIQQLQQENAVLSAEVQQQKQSLVKVFNDPDSNVNLSDLNQDEEITNPIFMEMVKKLSDSIPVIDKSDTQKGRWGGSKEKNGRMISVTVMPLSIPLLYKVHIKVTAIDKIPFSTPVAILLHSSFRPVIRLLNALDKTTVFLEVVAYEAFTVAALTDVKATDSYTALELDINDEPNLPSGFYWSDKD